MTMKENNKRVISFHYTLTDTSGTRLDSSIGAEPLTFLEGVGQIIPGLESRLAGLHVGDSKEVTVAPEDGYGKVDPSAFVEVPKTQLPKDVAPTIGMVLRGVNPDGKSFRATVSQVKNDTVMLDLNHPLAGKMLTFKVKITDLAPAKAQ